MTIYDPFSHWPSAFPIASTEAKVVVQCLKKHIARHSAPAEVLSDRGKNLMADVVREFLQDMGAKKLETTLYKPSTNGSVERFHGYLASALAHRWTCHRRTGMNTLTVSCLLTEQHQ